LPHFLFSFSYDPNQAEKNYYQTKINQIFRIIRIHQITFQPHKIELFPLFNIGYKLFTI
jgi:hypothetical protein